MVARQPHVQLVVLARHPEQVSELAELKLPNCTIPSSAIESRTLLYEADLVIGAGGTMTREAALMGVPTFTVFAGRAPAVDRWLEDGGLLERLTDAAQLAGIERRLEAFTEQRTEWEVEARKRVADAWRRARRGRSRPLR